MGQNKVTEAVKYTKHQAHSRQSLRLTLPRASTPRPGSEGHALFSRTDVLPHSCCTGTTEGDPVSPAPPPCPPRPPALTVGSPTRLTASLAALGLCQGRAAHHLAEQLLSSRNVDEVKHPKPTSHSRPHPAPGATDSRSSRRHNSSPAFGPGSGGLLAQVQTGQLKSSGNAHGGFPSGLRSNRVSCVPRASPLLQQHAHSTPVLREPCPVSPGPLPSPSPGQREQRLAWLCRCPAPQVMV